MTISEIGEEFSLAVGFEADRPAPQSGVIYLAKDTKTPWICYDESDGWELLSPITINERGNPCYEGKILSYAEKVTEDLVDIRINTSKTTSYTVPTTISKTDIEVIVGNSRYGTNSPPKNNFKIYKNGELVDDKTVNDGGSETVTISATGNDLLEVVRTLVAGTSTAYYNVNMRAKDGILWHALGMR